MKNVSVIASDIGGTLGGRQSVLSARTAKAVGQVLGAGIPFILVSGFNLKVVTRIREQIRTRNESGLWSIVQNGSLILKGNNIVERNYLDLEVAKEVVRFFCDKGLNPIAFASPEMDCRQFTQPVGRDTSFAEAYGCEIVPDIASQLLSDPIQISVYDDNDLIFGMRAEAECLFGGGRCNVIVSVGAEKSWLEITNARSSKLTALTTILRQIGARPEDVMYFGDNLNDVELLKSVGYPVVMNNGLPEVKKLARRIAADCDADGVAEVLEEYLALVSGTTVEMVGGGGEATGREATGGEETGGEVGETAQ